MKINKSTDISCYFLEHSFVDPKTLAELSVQAKNKFLFEPSDVVMLATCQRIELYSNLLESDPFIDIFGCRSQYVYGFLDVYRRLIQIGCGLRSQILGERFIYTQLKNTIYSLPKEHPMYLLGCSALGISQELRKKYNFYAKADYEEIALNLLKTQSSKQSSFSLIIIGGGHLAQAIANNAKSSNYRKVVVITRDAKKLRKNFLGNPLIEIYSIHTLPSNLLALPFHCFIATNNLNNVYHASLLDIVSHGNCQSIVDMSSVPMFSNHVAKDSCYTTMYDKSYLEVVEAANFLLRSHISELLSEIEGRTPFL